MRNYDDIEYEVEEEVVPDDDEKNETEQEENLSVFAEAVDSISKQLNTNRVLSPPEKETKTTTNNKNNEKVTSSKPSSSFADTVNKALSKILDEWKHLLDSEKQLTSISKLNPSGYCRREDEISNSKTLNAMLNVVYNRDSHFDVHASSNFLCDPTDAPKEEEHYFTSIPNAESLANFDDDEESWTVKNMNLNTFNEYSQQADYHYELMSCKPRPFSSKFTGLGEVILPPESGGK